MSSLSLSDLSVRRMPATWALVAVIGVVFLSTGLALVLAGFDPVEVLITGRPYRARLLVGGQVSGPIRAGAWWRLVTSTLLHVDAGHLALNVLALIVLGRWLEPLVGSVRWAGLFALTAVGASVVSHVGGVAQSDGASAGGLALLTGGVLLAWRSRASLDQDVMAVIPWLAGFLLVNLVITAVWSAVDATGHVAGVALGAVLGGVLPLNARKPERVGWGVVLVLYIGVLVWGVVEILR